ncbi:MAG TPA: hypothetical protein VF484_02175 [Candidatus Limnocylindrales bacterium]
MREGQPQVPGRGPVQHVSNSPRAPRRRVLLGVVTTLALLLGLALGAPGVTLGSSGFIETATTTYTLNPAADRVDVVIDLTFKNTKPSTATVEYYYTGVYIYIENQATHLQANAGGSSTRLEKHKTGKQFTEWFVHWEPVLFYGRSKHVHVTYRIPTGAPRSSSPFRVNPAYADFCVVSTGNDGGSTTVRVPLAYDLEVTTENGAFTKTESGGYAVYRTGALPKPYEFWGCLSGEDSAGYVRDTISSPSGRQITIESWPNDQGWETQVNSQIKPILTQLESIVGAGLPGVGGIEVREVGNGTLGNYAGFFDPDNSIARIGEDLDLNGLVAHELSHAWFNDSLFKDRWMTEGSAEWARTTIVKDRCDDPGKYPGTGGPHIGNWEFAGPRATDEELAIVDYQYAAACQIVTQVAAKIGEDRWKTVLAALMHHELAYRSGSTVPQGIVGPADWKTWLDAVDELGLVPAGETDLDFAQNLLKTYGIPEAGAPLEARSKARKAYHALAGSIGDWTLPEAILKPMGFWHFDEATKAMTTATDVYAKAGEVQATVPEADGRAGKVKTMFEAAKTQSDLDAALAEAQAEVDAAGAVKAARDQFAAPRDTVSQVGMLGMTLQPTVDAMVQAFVGGDLSTAKDDAAQVQATLDGAPQQGRTRLIGGAVAIGLVLLLIVFLVLRRRRRRAALALAAGAPTDATAESASMGANGCTG